MKKFHLLATVMVTATVFGLSSPAPAQDAGGDPNLTYVEDDNGNATWYDENLNVVKTAKVPVKPKKDPGKNVKLPNGDEVFAKNGQVTYFDPKTGTVQVQRNPNDPNMHTIIQNLMNGISAITKEGGPSVITLPGSGNWGFDPRGLLESTPYGPGGGPPGPNIQRTVDDLGVVTTIYTDPTTERTTTVIENTTLKGGTPATVIKDNNGTIVYTPYGPLIYGPDGKIISRTGYNPPSLEGGEGHHHGPGGTDIPDDLFGPRPTPSPTVGHTHGPGGKDIPNKPQNKPSKGHTHGPDGKDQPLYMKAYDPDISQAPKLDPDGTPFKSEVKINAKMGGPFRIKAEAKPTTNATSTIPMR